MRGGGGNFAVATSFEYRLHPVGTQVIGGMVTYPYSRARQVLEFFRDFSTTVPDELTDYACLICTADGGPAIGLAACYCGRMDRGETVVRPLRTCEEPIEDALRPMSYLELQTMMDPARPAGRLCAMRSHFMRELPDGVIAAIVEHFGRTPSPLSVAIIEHCHGAIARVVPEATAFALRTSPFHFEIIGFWENPSATTTNLNWVTDFFEAKPDPTIWYSHFCRVWAVTGCQYCWPAMKAATNIKATKPILTKRCGFMGSPCVSPVATPRHPIAFRNSTVCGEPLAEEMSELNRSPSVNRYRRRSLTGAGFRTALEHSWSVHS
jgi:hypothetical protein